MAAITTIERHILEQQHLFPEATGTFTSLLYDIALAAKLITRETTKAGLVNILGKAGEVNVQGEEQQKLDVYANDIIFRLMDHTGRLCIMASEESAEPLLIPDKYRSGHYSLLFDPLDGSSNIDYNVGIGTIFSVHRKISAGERGELKDLLQPGRTQVAAGYILYGPSTMLVYSTGQGVHGFTLDPSVGEFLLSHPNIRIPEKPAYYSINSGYEKYWPESIRRYIQWITGRDPAKPTKGLPLRYIGSMVADVHRTLLSGGIFLYPPDSKDPDKPHGKLRLCYECAPLAFLIEQAGGYASDGAHPLLDIQPTRLHQRVPLYIGSKDLVQKVEEYVREFDSVWVEEYRQKVEIVERGKAAVSV